MSEEELIYLVRCGNEWALEMLYEDYYSLSWTITYSLINKKSHMLEMEDIVSDTLGVFWQVVCGYRSDLDSTFHAYMKKCIKHRIYTSIRIRYRYFYTEYVSLDDNFVEENDEIYQSIVLTTPKYEIPDQVMIIKENQEELIRYSNKVLSSKEKDVYHCMISGLSAKEISEKLNINLKSVYNTSYRVSKKMNKNNM